MVAGKVKPQGGRNKFVEPDSPLIPPPIAAWRIALENVDVDPQNLVSNNRPSDSGYVFPDPGLFIGVTTAERQATYLTNYLIHRSELIFRLSNSNSSASPISNSLWRTFLTYGSQPLAPNASQTQAANRRKVVMDILANCSEGTGVDASPKVQPTSFVWRDTQVSLGTMPSLTICREILWELYELNFRFEFLGLDRRAHVSKGNASASDLRGREDLIGKCFARPPGSSLLVADVEYGNKGLAAESWSDRVPYVLAMRDVMKTWSGQRPQEFSRVLSTRPEQPSEQVLLALESAVARFYTQMFFNHFGRAAIVPHRLPCEH